MRFGAQTSDSRYVRAARALPGSVSIRRQPPRSSRTRDRIRAAGIRAPTSMRMISTPRCAPGPAALETRTGRRARPARARLELPDACAARSCGRGTSTTGHRRCAGFVVIRPCSTRTAMHWAESLFPRAGRRYTARAPASVPRARRSRLARQIRLSARRQCAACEARSGNRQQGTGRPVLPFCAPAQAMRRPAMSRCAQRRPCVNFDRKHAAVIAPPSRPRRVRHVGEVALELLPVFLRPSGMRQARSSARSPALASSPR